MASEANADRSYAFFLAVKEDLFGPPPWLKESRNFSQTDNDMLAKCLQNCGFSCQPPMPISSKDQLKQALRTVADQHEKYDRLLVYISAYGFKDNERIYCNKSLCNLYNHIVDIFGESCPEALVGKEKVFFMQACYPPDYSPVYSDSVGEEEDASSTTTTARRANISMFWSRIPANWSWHNAVQKGSLSVHHFCDILNSKTHQMTFGDIFIKVNARLVEDMKSHGLDVTTTPSWDSTATCATAI